MTTATGFAQGVAARVRQARREAGLSVEDLMASTGLSRQVIDDAEERGEVSTASLEALARAMGRPTHLLDRSRYAFSGLTVGGERWI